MYVVKSDDTQIGIVKTGIDKLLQVNAKVGGKLAQIGSRLIDAAVKKMANDFFKAFSENLAPPPAETTGEEISSEADLPQSQEIGSAQSSEGIEPNKIYYGLAAIGIIALAVYLLN